MLYPGQTKHYTDLLFVCGLGVGISSPPILGFAVQEFEETLISPCIVVVFDDDDDDDDVDDDDDDENDDDDDEQVVSGPSEPMVIIIYMYVYIYMIGVEVCCRKSLWRSCHFGVDSITWGILQVLSLERRWEKAFVHPSGFHNVGLWGLVIFVFWPLKTGKNRKRCWLGKLQSPWPTGCRLGGFTSKFGTVLRSMKWSHVTHIFETTGWPKTTN